MSRLDPIPHKLKFILQSKVEERFHRKKTCDEEPYLHPGTARSAVPPVGMTNLGWWKEWETPLDNKVLRRLNSIKIISSEIGRSIDARGWLVEFD
jgi:hypothetical protein